MFGLIWFALDWFGWAMLVWLLVPNWGFGPQNVFLIPLQPMSFYPQSTHE